VVRDILVVQVADARYVGRVPLTLRPGYRLFLVLEGFEDAVSLLLDDKVLDRATSGRPFGRASMNTVVITSSPVALVGGRLTLSTGWAAQCSPRRPGVGRPDRAWRCPASPAVRKQGPGGHLRKNTRSRLTALASSRFSGCTFPGWRCGKSETRPFARVGTGSGWVAVGSGGVVRPSPKALETSGFDRRSRSPVMAGKSRNWPRPALSRALQMGDAHPEP
jgi:hypothetical protein